MKMMILGIIFVCCSLFGFFVDADERKRLKELEEFIYLFELLKREIDYQLTPLVAASRTVASFGKGQVKQVFLDFATFLEEQEGETILKMWEMALEKNKVLFHLKEEDYCLLETFGSCCGYLDKSMQTRNLEMILEKLGYAKKQGEEKYEKCSKLNRSLGMLIGGALVIFLI